MGAIQEKASAALANDKTKSVFLRTSYLRGAAGRTKKAHRFRALQVPP